MDTIEKQIADIKDKINKKEDTWKDRALLERLQERLLSVKAGIRPLRALVAPAPWFINQLEKLATLIAGGDSSTTAPRYLTVWEAV